MNSDLHIHSNYSDGSYSPTKIVKIAAQKGLDVISLTDHSTIQGIKEFKKSIKNFDIEGIIGVEITSSIQNVEVHILGYFVDIENNTLNTLLNNIEKARSENTKSILINSDLDYSWNRVLEHYPQKRWLGCSDVYMSMMKDGYFYSLENYWTFYKKYYQGKDILNYVSSKEAIKAINEANGIPVLAHPKLIGDDKIIKLIIREGVRGLEVYHPVRDKADINRYHNLSKKYNLLITGGTDWHGKLTMNDVDIGDFGVSKNELEKLYNYNRTTSDNMVFP